MRHRLLTKYWHSQLFTLVSDSSAVETYFPMELVTAEKLNWAATSRPSWTMISSRGLTTHDLIDCCELRNSVYLFLLYGKDLAHAQRRRYAMVVDCFGNICAHVCYSFDWYLVTLNFIIISAKTPWTSTSWWRCWGELCSRTRENKPKNI